MSISLVFALAVVTAVGVAIEFIVIGRAPIGYEDETGFHEGIQKPKQGG